MDEVASSGDADETYQNPERIEQSIGGIPLQPGAPSQQDRVKGIDDPDPQKRTVRSQPTDQAKTANPH